MKMIKSEFLSEQVILEKHKSGLQVAVIPKKGFAKSYAIFATKFGSVDRTFKINGNDEWLTVPDGIAHFLEHKLFDDEDGNAFEKYSKTGASANAFTGFDKTAYLFSTTDNFIESLEILVSFVSKPYFTKESVEKEQGIIGQEITMYDDDSSWRVMFNLLGALYDKNPVKIDIAGTIESISKIDDQTLYDCYNTFYNLNNMVLCVVGDQKMEDVLAVCDKILKKAPPIEVETKYDTDEKAIASPYVEQKLPVALPLFMIGIKNQTKNLTGSDFVKNELAGEILLEMIGGKSSAFYEELYKSGDINAEFSKETLTGRGFFAYLFSGESENYKKVQEKLLETIESMKKTDNKGNFETAKKNIYGKYIKEFNSVEAIANNFITYYFAGFDYLQVIDLFKEISYDYCMEILNETFKIENMALSVILPN